MLLVIITRTYSFHYSFPVLMTINPINAESAPKKTAIISGAKGECANISVRIRIQIKPPPS